MISTKFKSSIRRNIYNIPGWRSSRKIVVIESDDWGSERTPSRSAYNYLLKKGVRVDLCQYSKYDSLENDTDLSNLFELLSKFKDKNGRHPLFTANYNLVNPDYKRIRESNFENYYYLTLPESWKNQKFKSSIIDIIKEGISEDVFSPQYHHREHLSPFLWIEQLAEGHEVLNWGFEAETYALSRITSPTIKKLHLAGLIYRNENEKEIVINALIDGSRIFKEIFGFPAESFIAPVYIWNTELETTFRNIGIKFIQSGYFQTENLLKKNKLSQKKFHYTGQKNKLGQIYTVRNCYFEPTLFPHMDSVYNCLKQISDAFRWGKPAIISSHRVNYIGKLDSSNRDNNLKLLDLLINKIVTLYPNVEFMSNVDLSKIIEQGS